MCASILKPFHLPVRLNFEEPWWLRKDDASDIVGMTPLHAAAKVNSPDCVERILIHGGKVDVKDQSKKQPIIYAGSEVNVGDEEEIRKYEQVLDFLLTYGADANANYKDEILPISRSALRTAAGLGSVDAVKKLLEKGANGKWGKDEGDGKTALHSASNKGHLNVLELLLSNEEKKLSEDQNGRMEDDDGITEWVNYQDKQLNTALYYAACRKEEPCVQFLLKKGGNHQIKNKKKMTPFQSLLKRKLTNAFPEFLDSLVLRRPELAENDIEFVFNWDALAPNVKEKRAEVLFSMIAIPESKDDLRFKILEHPLVKAFIKLNFRRARKILWFLIPFYFILLFTAALPLLFSLIEAPFVAVQVIQAIFGFLVLCCLYSRVSLNLPNCTIYFGTILNVLGTSLTFLGLLWYMMYTLVLHGVQGTPWYYLSTYWLLQWIGYISILELIPLIGTKIQVFIDIFRHNWKNDEFDFKNFSLLNHLQTCGIAILLYQNEVSAYQRIILFAIYLHTVVFGSISKESSIWGKETRRFYLMLEFLDLVEKIPFSYCKRSSELPSLYTSADLESLDDSDDEITCKLESLAEKNR